MSFSISEEIKSMSAKEKEKAGKSIIDDLKKEGKNKKSPKQKSDYTKYLEKQLQYKKQKYEEQKKRQLEKIKERRAERHTERAKQALRGIKYQSISYKDPDATAYQKAIGNVGSAASGLAAAAYHGARALAAKRKAEKEAEQTKEKQAKKKEPKPPGRKRNNKQSQVEPERKVLSGSPERKKLVPSTKRLVPSTKRLPPSGGIPKGEKRDTGMSLGQRARRNPELKKKLIAKMTQTEEYFDWRKSFLSETEISSDAQEKNGKKKNIIDVMKGKNKIELNPTINERADEEGGMIMVELDSIEKAVESIRKKIKNRDKQFPAWIQSKITRATDYLNSASDYLDSNPNLDESSSSCSSKRIVSTIKKINSERRNKNIQEIAPAIAAVGRLALGSGARSAAVRTGISSGIKDLAKEKLKSKVLNSLSSAGQKVKEVDSSGNPIEPEDGGASAYRKAISNIVKIGEETKINKEAMKCNKPKAQAHGSGETGKSHVVKACEGGEEKIIRFGQKGVKGSPKKEGESEEYASRRHRFQSRHAKNIAKGKMSAAYWANKVKW